MAEQGIKAKSLNTRQSFMVFLHCGCYSKRLCEITEDADGHDVFLESDCLGYIKVFGSMLNLDSNANNPWNSWYHGSTECSRIKSPTLYDSAPLMY